MLNYTPKGWIKLHRDLERQEVFKNSDTLRVFLYLVCRAVTEPTTYRDVTINRGQLAITYPHLNYALNISQKRLRSIIGALKTAGYLAVKRAYGKSHGFTLITICEYDNYQAPSRGSKTASGQSIGQSNGQSNGRNPPVDTLYNEKEISTKVDKEEKTSPSPDFEKILIEKLIEDDVWKSKIAETFGLNESELIKRLDEFFISNECRGKFHSDLSDMKSHFVNWLKIILNPKTNNTTNNENLETRRRDQRRGMDAGVHSAEEFEGPF